MDAQFKTLQTFDTEYSADTVEWCPTDGYHNYFLCGTYQLEENNDNNKKPEGDDDETTNDLNPIVVTKRKGRIYLMKYEFDENQLTVMDVHETAAILDQKWFTNNNNKMLFCCCNGLGEIQLYKMNENKINHQVTKHLNPELNDILALSLDITNNVNDNLIVSDSKGYLSLIKCTNSDMIIERKWLAHNYEAWTCTFDKQNENIVYSGGDDTFLNIYDTRCNDNHPQLMIKNKLHDAGVTSILNFQNLPNHLVTGSYDENLRLFDKRNFKQTINELNLNGGIWRLKSNPFNELLILNACMYYNFSVVKLYNNNNNCNNDITTTTTTSINKLKLIGEYFEHNSICYGNDWSHYSNNKKLNFSYLATCSFYDHKLNISSLEIKNVD